MADVFYCFVAVIYHEGILIYLFSWHEKLSFNRLFPHGRCYSLHFITFFLPQSSILGTIALVFRFAFTDI